MKNRQQGLTLIELLIAMGLGLFLLAGMAQVFLGSLRSFDVIHSQASMQEAGRFGVEFIAKATRHAGYINAGPIDGDFAAKIVNITDTEAASEEQWPNQNSYNVRAVVAGVDGGGGPDTFSVRMQGDPDSLMFDCSGANMSTNEAVIVRMTFAVDTTNNQLTCQISGGNAVPLVEGVEDMQVLYGISTNTATPHLPGKYVSASALAATEWKDIVAVRIGLLAISDNAPLSTDSKSYTVLDETVSGVSDGRSRQVFTQTVAIRNKLSG